MIDSMLQQAEKYYVDGEPNKMLETAEFAAKISYKKFGPADIYTSCVDYQVKALYNLRQFKDADSLASIGLKIREKLFGRNHPAYAASLLSFARIYKSTGRETEAIETYYQILDIYEYHFGKDPSESAGIYIELAELYKWAYKYEKSEELYFKSKQIIEEDIGQLKNLYANVLNDIGLLYSQMGESLKAEDYYLRSKDLFKEIYGEDHFYYSIALQNLGTLYRSLGLYEKARMMLEECIEIRKKLFERHDSYFISSNNYLAAVYTNLGLYEKSEELLLKCKKEIEDVHGKEQRQYGWTIELLASLYIQENKFTEAEELYMESLEIRKSSKQKYPLTYGAALGNLVKLYNKQALYLKAEPIVEESCEILSEFKAILHPMYIRSLMELAVAKENLKKYSIAEPLFAEAFEARRKQLNQASNYLSEKELADHIQLFKEDWNRLLTYSKYRFDENISINMLAEINYENALFYKGFLLNSANRLRGLTAKDSTTVALNNELKSYQRRLARGFSLSGVSQNKESLDMIQNKIDEIEKALLQKISRYDQLTNITKIKDVQGFLGENEAAIEFLHFESTEEGQSDSIFYVAVILLPSKPQPFFIPLFEEKELLKSSSKDIAALDINPSATTYSRGIVPVNTNNYQNLYRLIWKPVDSLLLNVKKVFISPTGFLHRINFNAIPLDKNTNLSDLLTMVNLNSTRSIASPDSTDFSLQNEAILLGGIYYDFDTTNILFNALNLDYTLQENNDLSSVIAQRSLGDQGRIWQNLRGTLNEVESIASILEHSGCSTTALKGREATEYTFKRIGKVKPSPRILHIATHGFFFPDVKDKPVEGNNPVFKRSNNPMIRSGLILAFGNYAWQTGKPMMPGEEDGILTALEISQMDLSSTELVVLSACESGLGDLSGNEGVYGLQRAFKIAGVKNLIMSLWQIPDLETSEFMITFYDNWIQNKLTVRDAFQRTQTTMRIKYQNPFYWAGFLLLE